MNISRPFIERPVATALLMAAVLISGLLAYGLLPVSALPQVDYPTIRVLTFYPGASPEVMTSSVTAPLERQFGQMPGLDQMSSTSSGGASVITLRFALEKPLDVAEQEVQAAINAANTLLPNDLPQPPVYNKVNPADTPVLTLAITSKTVPLPQVHDLVDTRVAQKLSQLPGVGLVSIAGGQRPAVRIQANPQALAAHNLNLESLREVVSAANVNQPKGNFDGPERSFMLDANDQLRSPAAYKDLIVAYRDGAPLRLSDVADVVDGAENRRLAAWANELPAVLVNVQRQPGANVIAVVDRVHRAAADAHGQPAVHLASGRHQQSHRNHPGIGARRAARARLRRRARRPRHVPVPQEHPGDRHPECRGAAVADRDLRRDVPGRVLGQQPDPHGAHHRDRLRRGRRDRHDGEHRAPHRGRRDAIQGGADRVRRRSGSR